MRSGSTLVPITREYLKMFYSKHPMESVPPEVEETTVELLELGELLTKPGSQLPLTVGLPEIPTRIDDNFWRNRMFCEETAENILKLRTLIEDEDMVEACTIFETQLRETERGIFNVQTSNTVQVSNQIKAYLPRDFRGSLIESRAKANEVKYTDQISNLVKSGCSVREKYDTYLQQQWERRVQLAELASASGFYKLAMRYLAGIPDVLLDFAKQVNAKLGPLEEQRLKYGPDLYKVSALGNALNLVAALCVESLESMPEQKPAVLRALNKAVPLYCIEVTRVISFIGHIFQVSPFFITEEELNKAQEGDMDAVMIKAIRSEPSITSLTESTKTTDLAVESSVKSIWSRFGFSSEVSKN